MKKIIIAIFVLLSMQSFGQFKLYAIKCNTNGSIDSIYKKILTDSLFIDEVFVQFSREHFNGMFDPVYPNGFEHYIPRADGIWIHTNCIGENITKIPTIIDDALDGKANLNHTHTVSDLSNATTVGANLLAIANPASPSLVRINSNGSVVPRTAAEAKQDLSLDAVDNTSDANKPISSATQTALNNKTTYYTGTDAGANDSYVVTLSPVPPSLTAGMIVIFRANTANTTGCTINVNGLGVTTIVKRVSTTPATGDILALMWCMLIYNGTNFILLNPVVN